MEPTTPDTSARNAQLLWLEKQAFSPESDRESSRLLEEDGHADTKQKQGNSPSSRRNSLLARWLPGGVPAATPQEQLSRAPSEHDLVQQAEGMEGGLSEAMQPDGAPSKADRSGDSAKQSSEPSLSSVVPANRVSRALSFKRFCKNKGKTPVSEAPEAASAQQDESLNAGLSIMQLGESSSKEAQSKPVATTQEILQKNSEEVMQCYVSFEKQRGCMSEKQRSQCLKRIIPLIEKGVDFNTDSGKQLLLRATIASHTEGMQILLDQGAPIDAISYQKGYGATALLAATIIRDESAVQLLLKNRANPFIADTKHQKPLDYAKQRDNGSVIKLLTRAEMGYQRAVVWGLGHESSAMMYEYGLQECKKVAMERKLKRDNKHQTVLQERRGMEEKGMHRK